MGGGGEGKGHPAIGLGALVIKAGRAGPSIDADSRSGALRGAGLGAAVGRCLPHFISSIGIGQDRGVPRET